MFSLSPVVMAFSKHSLMKIALLLDEEEEMRQSKRTRRFWVHPLATRQEDGEYTTLYRQLVNDDVKFYNYFRMFHGEYIDILSTIEIDLKKEHTILESYFSHRKTICLLTVSKNLIFTIFVCFNMFFLYTYFVSKVYYV